MAIITKPSAIDKGVENVITLNKADLASDTKVVADSYFSDQNNWNTIYITYKTPEGQVNDVIFDASEASPVGSFNPSLKGRDAWEVQSVTIQDFDNGSLKLLRGDLTVAEFDIAFNVAATTQSAFDPSVSSSSNLTFSNANRTVSSDNNSPPYAISLSQATTTASSKLFASFQCGIATGQSQFYIHFSSVAPVSGAFSSPNLSSIFLNPFSLNSGLVYWEDSVGNQAGVNLGTFAAIATGDLVEMAVDLALAKLYIRVNGVWQNGEAGVSGGYDIPPASVTDYTGQQVYKRVGVESGEEYTLTETPVNVPSGYELV